MPEYVPRRTRKTPPKRGGKVWKQAVDLAYDLLVGRTRTEACERTGISRRTSQRWLRSEWWKDAHAEAYARWQKQFLANARGAIVRGAAEDHRFAAGLLQRAGELGGDGMSEQDVVQLVRRLAEVVVQNVTDERTLAAIHEGWRRAMLEHGAPTKALGEGST